MPTTTQVSPHAPLTIAQLLQGSAWFPLLDVAAGERVLDEMREVEVPAGGSLCRRGDTPVHWYGTIDGLLKWCVTSPDGRSVTLGGLSNGSWFGEGTLLRGVPRTADIIALRPSRVALMPLETFQWLRATHRSFDDFLLRQINERMHWFLGNFTAHHLLDTDSQVARACGSVPRMAASRQRPAPGGVPGGDRQSLGLRRASAAMPRCGGWRWPGCCASSTAASP